MAEKLSLKWNTDEPVRVMEDWSPFINMRSMSTDVLEVDAISAPASDARPTSPTPAAAPERLSRRKLLRRVFGFGAFAAASGVYAREVEPFWVQWHDLPMPLRHLPKSFEGFRITHLTDLHAGDAVPLSYLRRVVEQVKQMKPDLVVVTGDLVNHSLDAVGPICEVLNELPLASIPVIASLGNHDYDISSVDAGNPGMPTRIADALDARLKHLNIPLRRARGFLERPVLPRRRLQRGRLQ